MISSPESEVKVLVPVSHPANQRGVFSHPSLSLHSVRPHRLITAMIFNPERTKHRGSLLKHGLLGPTPTMSDSASLRGVWEFTCLTSSQ